MNFFMYLIYFPGALIMFCIRLYLNDLYVSIPDRLLITCALAQTLHNVPVEALIAEGNMWEASPYLKLLDDISKFVLVSSFFLFWLIYTKDKVSYLLISYRVSNIDWRHYQEELILWICFWCQTFFHLHFYAANMCTFWYLE